MTRLILSLTCAAVLCVAPGRARADTPGLIVFAAASLKNVLDEAAAQFTRETGTPVALSYAGSSALARQIQLGAPADLFVSANADWMDALADDGLIRPDSRTILAGNALVLIGSRPGSVDLGQPDALTALLSEDDRLAMALVQAVPAGIYGRAALQSLNLWASVQPHVVQTDNVRAALRLVALGEARLGIVYATDALAEPGVSVLARFPDRAHPPIRYPAALTTEGTNPQAASLLAFLSGDAGQAIFTDHGFLSGGQE